MNNDPPNLMRMVSGEIAPAPAGLPPVLNAEPYSQPSGLSLQTMWSRKGWVIGTAILLCLGGLPAVWLLWKPNYQATAVVHVSPRISRIAFNTEHNGVVPFYDSHMNTQVSYVRSPAVLSRVLERENVRETKWFQAPASWLSRAINASAARPIDRLLAALEVTPLRQTELIKVSVVAPDASEAKLIADAVVEEYRRYAQEEFHEGDAKRFETLREEQDGLRREIDGLVSTKFNLSKRLGTTDPEELRSQLTRRLVELQVEHAQRTRHLELVKWQLNQLPSELGPQLPTSEDNGRIMQYGYDDQWSQLFIAFQSKKHQLETSRRDFGERHPTIAALEMDVAHAQRLLELRQVHLDERAKTLGNFAQAPGQTPGTEMLFSRQALEHMAGRLEKEISSLKTEITQQEVRVSDAGTIAKEIAQYEEDISYKREMYQAVRSRLEELSVESKAPARVSIAAYAMEPSAPYRDRRILLSVLAFGGALLCGAGVGYLRNAFDPTVQQVDEVRVVSRMSFLGQLPTISNEPVVECNDPHVVESVRMVRTALLQRLNPSGVSVLITSASSETGKTTVSVLLARSLAAIGKKILLVEADLRRPTLAKCLAMQHDLGLAELLNGTEKDPQPLMKRVTQNFDVLLAGEAREELDAEPFSGDTFRQYLDAWRKSYDYVLLDSPPLLPVADSVILADIVDATIMIVRAAHSRRQDITRAYNCLATSRSELVGTILVGVPNVFGYGYYNGYYSTYTSIPARGSSKRNGEVPV